MKKLILGIAILLMAVGCSKDNTVDIRDNLVGVYNSNSKNLTTNQLIASNYKIEISKSSNSDNIVILITKPGSTDFVKFNCTVSYSETNNYTFNIIPNQTATINGTVCQITKYFTSRDGYYFPVDNALRITLVLNGIILDYNGGKNLN
ncbi:MAG: hypothetical protein WCJ61_10600 [Paludibacter sp.]